MLIETPEQQEILERILADEWYWFTHYYYTLSEEGSKLFPDWGYLKHLLEEISQPGCFLVEKTRQLLISWLLCGHYLYNVQYTPDWSGFMTSRKELEVDDGGERATAASLFGRILFAHRHQPDWLKIPLEFSHLKIKNAYPDMENAYIIGESANPNSGRGKSFTVMLGDEFAYINDNENVHSAMHSATYRTLIYVSSSNFIDGAFHRIRHTEKSEFKVISLHWTQHPERDQEWYEKKTADLPPAKAAREQGGDENNPIIIYDLTTELRVYPRFQYEMHTAETEDMPTEDGQLYLGFDEGRVDPGVLLLGRWLDGTLYIHDEIYETGLHTILAPEDRGEEGDWLSNADKLRDKWGAIKTLIVGWESHTAEDVFRAAGYNTYHVIKDKMARIWQTDKMMILTKTGKPHLLIDRKCVNVIYEASRYELKVVNGVITDRPKAGKDHAIDVLAGMIECICGEQQVPAGDWIAEW